MDLFRREAVAILNGPEITAELVKVTLDFAVQRRQSGNGLILHSDQGVQYASHDFQKHCVKYGIQQSMSSAGCPYQELDRKIYDFVYTKYNQQRPHCHNNGQSPIMVA